MLIHKQQDSKSPKKPVKLFFRAFRYLKPYWVTVIGAYVMMTGITLLAIAIAQLIRSSVDRGMALRDLRLLGLSVLGIISLTLIKGVFVFLQGIDNLGQIGICFVGIKTGGRSPTMPSPSKIGE